MHDGAVNVSERHIMSLITAEPTDDGCVLSSPAVKPRLIRLAELGRSDGLHDYQSVVTAKRQPASQEKSRRKEGLT
jgi:hypothetical protein